MSTHTLTVPFHGADLLIFDVDGQPYTPIKPIVEAIGLDWRTQHRKLQTHQARWATVVIKRIVAADGKLREMLCLPLRKLAGWLLTISPSRAAPAIREALTHFQNECDDVLWEHWSQHRPTPNALRQLPETLTPAEQQGLQELAVARAQDWGPAKGKVLAEIWSRVHRKFHVAKYEQLTRTQLPAVTTYVLTMELRTPRPTAETPAAPPDAPATGPTATAAVQHAINRKAWSLAQDAYDLCRDGLTRRVAHVALTEAQALSAVAEASLAMVLAPRLTQHVETVQILAGTLVDIAVRAHQQITAEVGTLGDLA